MTPVPFTVFRWTTVALAVFAQLYLFWRLRQAIRASGFFARHGSAAVAASGIAIAILFAVNAAILSRPIPWADPPPAAQAFFFYLPAVWGLGSIFSALILLLVQIAGGLGHLFAWIRRGRGAASRPAPESPGRRRFLQAGLGGLAAAPFLLSGYGAAWAGRGSEVEELDLPFGCALRVVQLTDVHAGVFMTREQMRRYVDLVRALAPELFVLTGDYISNSTVFFQGFVEEMAKVRARYGTFATLGNHEHWYGRFAFYEEGFRRHGIRLLQNEHRLIQTDRGRFAIAGIDDLRWGRPDLGAALRGLDSGVPTLLLSHRPEIFPQAAERGVGLTLAGHYHGGQITLRLPGGDLSVAHLRTPYPEGLYELGAARLYVSRGIGTTFTPVRLNAPPEVTLLRLT